MSDEIDRGTSPTLRRSLMALKTVIMPWKTSSVMEEKLRFVFTYERDEESMKALCARFGISRETGYVWLRRYRQSGSKGWWN